MCKIRIRLVFSFSSTSSVRTNRFHAITLIFPDNIGPAKCKEKHYKQPGARGVLTLHTSWQHCDTHRSTCNCIGTGPQKNCFVIHRRNVKGKKEMRNFAEKLQLHIKSPGVTKNNLNDCQYESKFFPYFKI